MPAEERYAKASRPEGDEAREHSLGVLARGLADGSVSRKQALKWGGSALLGGVLASIPEVALASHNKTGHAVRGRRPAGERGQIAVYGNSPLVGTPLNMTVDEDRRFWWTDVTTKGLGSIEPLSADPGSTIRRIDLPNGSLPMQPRLGPGGTIWYTDAGRNGFGRIDAGTRDPAATLEFFTTDGMPPLLGLAPLGPDGRFWFGSRTASIVGCFDPASDDPAQSAKIFESSALSGVTGLYPGPDDHIWIANVGADSIARIDPLAPDPGATIEAFPRPPGGIHPRAMRVGPDKKLWFLPARPGCASTARSARPRLDADHRDRVRVRCRQRARRTMPGTGWSPLVLQRGK